MEIGNHTPNAETILLDSPTDFTEILNHLETTKTKIEANKKMETLTVKSQQMGYGLIACVICGIIIIIIILYILQ